MRGAVRNFSYNLWGQLAPMLVAVVAMPLLAHHAGPDRLGFIGLAWALIGYFALLDLGLSRVVTRRIAIAHGRGLVGAERRIVTRLCIALFVAVALVSALLAVVIPVEWVIGAAAPPAIVDEARLALPILWATVPATVVVGILRGTLEGQQLFGRANALRSLFGVLSFAAPIAVLPFSVGLPALIVAIAVGRYLSLIAYVAVVRRAWPVSEAPGGGVAPDRANTLTRMLREGAWLSVSNLVGPIMVTFDRLAIAHLLSLAAAAYYLVPQEIALRVLVIPAAVATTIFPMLSHAGQPLERHGRISRDGLLAVACLSLPVCIALALFAPFLLSVWMGGDFARASGSVAAIIAVGLFANCCAQAPFAWIQAGGRSDITGKLHLLQLPVYIALLYAATIELGIVGAALVWSARALADYALLLVASARLFPHLRTVVSTAMRDTWVGVALLVAIVASRVAGASPWITGACALAGLFVAMHIAMPLLEDRRR